ncbi:MAG: hypothetical protein ABFS37_11275, partial [Acidobacteriota bacterium]
MSGCVGRVLVIEDEAATVADLVVALDAAAAAGYSSLYLGYPEARLGGLGGGGSGWGTLGAGRHGGGGGSGSGYGSGGKSNAPVVRGGGAVAKGALDKNIIRRYIRR